MLIYKLTFLVTAFLLALIAGLFYAYSCSINPGLGKLGDGEYLRAMQSINRAILNPWFFASFMGTLLLMPVFTWMVFKNEGVGITFYLVLAAAVIYAAGVFGVTVIGNVPLNESLDKANLDITNSEQLKTLRAGFEISWNKFHGIRTGANLISLLLFLLALARK